MEHEHVGNISLEDLAGQTASWISQYSRRCSAEHSPNNPWSDRGENMSTYRHIGELRICLYVDILGNIEKCLHIDRNVYM
jgi:hypothetical protein